MEIALGWIQENGYTAIFLLLFLGIVGLPIPDETLLVFASYLSFKGELSTPFTVLSAALGSSCGVTVSYSLGLLFGPRVKTTFGRWLHLTDARYRTTQLWMDRWGPYALLVAYFVPGLRHLGAMVVGASGMRYPVFAAFAYFGACLWSSAFITVGYLLGEEWRSFSRPLHQTFTWTVFGTLLSVCITLLVMRRRFSRQS